MDITGHATFLPHDDPDASPAFHRDALGFKVRGDGRPGTFTRVRAGGAQAAQEPARQPYGVRDRAFRHPAGNLTRINEIR
ncbi:hypothetical protein [Streptosporangium vulgare]|uniref:Glyoxalase n=1 Tax=Streptosporangium vulgare TaxID=46190 RepID=A0ABV5TT40_9ACTN